MTVGKLIIVGTHTTETHGGISSALAGYEAGFDQLGTEYIRINSHSDIRGRVTTWFLAWCKVFLYAMRYRSKAVFWFHCGPWFSMLRKFSFAIPARFLGCQTIAHMHSPTLAYYLSNRRAKYLLKLFFMPFNSVITLTPWWKEQLALFGIKNPIDVCPNPVSKDVFAAANEVLSCPCISVEHQDKIVILTMARLIEGKGIEDVIAALALLPESYHLNIAGEGPLRPQLVAQCQRLNLEGRITFLGWVEGLKKQHLMQQSDLFCLPSKYDSFGVVFIEAMAFNLPVIACDWGPISDVVTEDVGVLVPYNNPSSVANSLTLLAKSKSEYNFKGPKRVIEYFSPATCCQKIAQIVMRLLNKQ